MDPASRTEYQAGELAQCDLWFPAVDVPLGFGDVGRPPVLVMVSGCSRVITATMIPTRQSTDLLAGHWRLISGWGRVPRVLVWDNESAVGKWGRTATADRDDERFSGQCGYQGAA